MKTRAWDGERFRDDYVVMPDGTLWRYEFSPFSGNRPVEQVDWKLSHFTGLCDTNEIEIYEGAIVDDGIRKYVVVYDDNKFKFYLKHTKPGNNRDLIRNMHQFYSIVGDIFTTPELLDEV